MPDPRGFLSPGANRTGRTVPIEGESEWSWRVDSFTVREQSDDGYLPVRYSWFMYGTRKVEREREEEFKSDKEDVEERPESTQFLSPLKRAAVPGYCTYVPPCSAARRRSRRESDMTFIRKINGQSVDRE